MRRNRTRAYKNTPWTTADDYGEHRSAHRPLLLLMLTRTNKLRIKPNQTDRFCPGYIIYLNLTVRRVIGKRRGVYSRRHSLQISWKAYFPISRSEMWVILPAARMTADDQQWAVYHRRDSAIERHSVNKTIIRCSRSVLQTLWLREAPTHFVSTAT